MAVVATRVSWNQDLPSAGGGFDDNDNISNGFRTLGLANTSDTGQASPPATKNDMEVFKFTDSLQATAPVIFKIYYNGRLGGVGDSDPPAAYQVQVGIATDGAGNFVGNNYSPLVNMVPQGGNGPTSAQTTVNFRQYVYMSGATNRITVAIGEGPDVNANLVFNIERTKDLSGNDTSDGIIFQWVQSNYSYLYCRLNGAPSAVGNMVIPFNGTVAGYNSLLNSAINEQSNTLASPMGRIASLPITPFNFRPYNAGMGLQLYYSSDFPMYTPFTIPMYGANHTYLPLNQGRQVNYTGPLSAPVSLMMRYE
jgi:hypothetical protein